MIAFARARWPQDFRAAQVWRRRSRGRDLVGQLYCVGHPMSHAPSFRSRAQVPPRNRPPAQVLPAAAGRPT